MTKRAKHWILGLAIFGVVCLTLLVATAYRYREHFAIDACLDDGGRYDYTSHQCEPGSTRH